MDELFNLPEGLSDLGSEELAALEQSGVTEFQALAALGDAATEENVVRMGAIVDGLDAIRSELATRASAPVAAATEPVVATEPIADRIAVLAARAILNTPSEPAPVVASITPVVPAPKLAPAVKPARPPAPVVTVPESTRSPLVIVASSDIPGVPMGSHLGFGTLCDAMVEKSRVIGNSLARHPVAQVHKQFAEGYDLRNLTDGQITNRLEELASVSAYEASLTASGGWCAPSEIIYELFETICPNPSLFTLPTFRANRGGVRWPIYVPLDFSTVVDWIWTEADDIAAAPPATTPRKPCILIPCPVFDECRLDAHGVCIIVGNLMNLGYPENVAWYLRRVFFFHARNESLFKLNAVIAESDPFVVDETFGAASAVIGAVLLAVQSYRDRNGLCCGAMIEAAAPCWLKEAFRADIARMEFGGVGNAGLVSDATINQWFADAGVSISFLSYWQAFEGAAPGPIAWPDTVQILLYTPGSFVQFDNGTLDLGITRDSVLNASNDYNIFTEDFFCIGRRGPRGVLLTVPICPLGTVGGRNNVTDEAVCIAGPS